MRVFCLSLVFTLLVPSWDSHTSAAPPIADQVRGEIDAPTKNRAAIIPLHGEIDPAMQAFLNRKLQHARQQQVDVLVLEIDSPGGYADISFDIARQIQSLRWAKTVAYVPREAISGAAIIALGADEIYLQPSAMMGDCGVIQQDHFAGPFRYTPEKILSKYVADIRRLAKDGNRPEAIAEAMMNKDVEVFQATHEQDQRTWYFTKSEFESMPDRGAWTQGKLVHESRAGNFLTITGTRAVELQVASGVVDSQDQLLDHLHVADDPIVLRRDSVDRAVRILNSPWLTFLLFVVGLLALFIELSAPGLGMGGLVSLLCFGLFFWSRFLGGTAGWLEVLLFVLGLIFIVCELLVIPGFGLPGITGFLLMVGSLVMASRRFVWPENSRDLDQLNSTLMTVAASVVAFIVLAIVCSRYLLDFPFLNRLALIPPSAQPEAGSADRQSIAGAESSVPWEAVNVGDMGNAIGPLRPGGKVDFGVAIVDVISDGEFIETGTAVRIIQKQGTRVIVRRVD